MACPPPHSVLDPSKKKKSLNVTNTSVFFRPYHAVVVTRSPISPHWPMFWKWGLTCFPLFPDSWWNVLFAFSIMHGYSKCILQRWLVRLRGGILLPTQNEILLHGSQKNKAFSVLCINKRVRAANALTTKTHEIKLSILRTWELTFQKISKENGFAWSVCKNFLTSWRSCC